MPRPPERQTQSRDSKKVSDEPTQARLRPERGFDPRPSEPAEPETTPAASAEHVAPSGHSFSHLPPVQRVTGERAAPGGRQLETEVTRQSPYAPHEQSIEREEVGDLKEKLEGEDRDADEVHAGAVKTVQRQVITVGKVDKTLEDTISKLKSKGSVATIGDVNLSEIGEEERIYIVAHGYHSLSDPDSKNAPTNLLPVLQGGVTAAQLYQAMAMSGWSPEHTGPIDIRACMTGAPSVLLNFAELFTLELSKNDRANEVTGYEHLTVTTGSGEEEAGETTSSKMLQVVKRMLDDEKGSTGVFAETVVSVYELADPGISNQRKFLGKYFSKKNLPAQHVGRPPESSNMSDHEWLVFTYYYAIATGDRDLASDLKKFDQKYEKEKAEGAHDIVHAPIKLTGQDLSVLSKYSDLISEGLMSYRTMRLLD